MCLVTVWSNVEATCIEASVRPCHDSFPRAETFHVSWEAICNYVQNDALLVEVDYPFADEVCFSTACIIVSQRRAIARPGQATMVKDSSLL